jgi:hypothetical protein
LGCAGNQKDHHHYRQPIFHTSYLYPDEPAGISHPGGIGFAPEK